MTWRSLTPLVALWTTSLVAINLVVITTSQRQIQTQISDYLGTYLLRSLDAKLFGSSDGVVNDRNSILDVGRKLNSAITEIVRDRWYSAFNECRVVISAIDDIVLPAAFPAESQLVVSVDRNAIERPVLVNYRCMHAVRPHLLWSSLLGALFLVIYAVVPLPLSRSQRERVSTLVAQGYGQPVALHYAVKLDVDRLNYLQRACLDLLHRPEARNYESAFHTARTADLARLTLDQQTWFLLALARTDDDVQSSLALARHADIVEIDLRAGTLVIHGMGVSINKTPLFYLAWYAAKRQAGDGWVANPRSNRPDRNTSRELAELMLRYDGHGRAVRDLEEHGLKARTLDQNRSKIKDDIVAALGEQLGGRYLFDVRKDPIGKRTCYRFKPDASRIRIRG